MRVPRLCWGLLSKGESERVDYSDGAMSGWASTSLGNARTVIVQEVAG